MSDAEKPKFNPTATIQIDLDQVQLVDPEAAPGGDAEKLRRTAPPPLPAASAGATAMPEVMASAATPAPRASVSGHRPSRKDAKLALHLGVVIGVVVLAVAAGLVVAWRVRAGGAASAASASPSAAPGSVSASAPSSSGVLTIPPIEVR